MHKQDEIERDNYLLLAKAINHFDDRSNLDDRCYYMTIKVPDENNIQRLYTPVYQKINKAFGNSGHQAGINRIGIIFTGDITGSEKKECNYQNPKGPHIHGLLFFPIGCQFSETEIIGKVKLALQDLREVGKDALWLGKFDANRSHLIDVIGYNMKANRSFHGQHLSHYKEAVYPYDLDLKHGDEATKELLSQSQARLLGQLIADHSPFFANSNQKGLTSRGMALNRPPAEKLDALDVAELVRKFESWKGKKASDQGSDREKST